MKITNNKDFGDNAKFVGTMEVTGRYLSTLPNKKRINLMNGIIRDFDRYLEEHWEEFELLR